MNHDAIEVAKVADIPSDYPGEMGVPVTFLDKYRPDQFGIIGLRRHLASPMEDFAKKGTYVGGGTRFYLREGETCKCLFPRMVIRNKNPEQGAATWESNSLRRRWAR